MKNFFLNEKQNIGLIQKLIEEYSGLVFKDNEIFYKCEKCHFYIASQDIIYNACYNYPGRELIISEETINKKICCHCFVKINNQHNITSTKDLF